MIKIASKFLAVLAALFTIIVHAEAREFTDEEVDDIIIRSQTHASDFQKFAAISQQVYYTSIIESPSTPDERKLAIAMGKDVWGGSSSTIFMRTDPLETILPLQLQKR